MELDQLKLLVKKGESENLEFKATTANLSAGMHTVCAFLNSDTGGIIIFGVKDDGKIIGQDVTDKTRKDIAVELKKIEPYAKPNIKYVPVNDTRFAIVIQVDAGENAPYTYEGRPFTRQQSTTTRMLRDEYDFLYNKNNPAAWEKLTNNTCTVRDLDKKRIKEVVQMAVHAKRLPESAISDTIPAVLKRFSLVDNGKLKNAAVILFCKKEENQFMQSQIKLARFRGIDKKAFTDNKFFIGNAFDLYDKAMDFLVFGLPLAAYIEEGKWERTEVPAIPYSVLREALTNALIHRDYSNSGGSAEVAIYTDRVNISNIGSLPRGLDIKELSKQHQSLPRNPLIANIFYLCGKIEKWGRGTIEMIQECKRVGNPAPKYETTEGSFSVTLPFKESIQTVLNYEVKPSAKRPTELTRRQKKVLTILQNGPLGRETIMKLLKTTITSRAMTNELSKLRDLGLIKSHGSGKAIVWVLVD